MSIIGLLVILVVIGVGLYLVSLIPMDPKILLVIRCVVILAAVVWVLSFFVDLGIATPHVRHM